MAKARALGPVALWALCTWSTAAWGQSQDALARAHFSSGSSYYEQGRYEEALHEFEEATRLASDRTRPLMIFNLGQTQERLGHLTAAISSFQAYRDALSPGAAERALVEERIRNIQARLDATAIVLSVSETGARVLVDGEERGTTPLAGPLRVTPGAHEIRVEREGFQPLSIRVSVEPGQRLETEATLVAIPPPPAPAPVAAPPPPPLHRPPRPAPPPEPPGRFYTWVAAGVAGAAAVGGGVLGVLALGERDAANEAASQRDPDTYEGSKSSAEDLSLFADIAFGVAVLGAGAAVILFFVEGSAPPAAARETAATPLVLPGGGGVAVTGWF